MPVAFLRQVSATCSAFTDGMTMQVLTSYPLFSCGTGQESQECLPLLASAAARISVGCAWPTPKSPPGCSTSSVQATGTRGASATTAAGTTWPGRATFWGCAKAHASARSGRGATGGRCAATTRSVRARRNMYSGASGAGSSAQCR
jgi:hypothetical protein